MKYASALKKGLLLVWSLCALLFLASCNSDSTLTNNSGDLKGTVTFYIVDIKTNLPVDDVKVEFTSIGTKNTDKGYVSFGDVKAGSYFVRLSKKGYESIQTTVTSEVEGSETVVSLNISETLRLHKQGTKLRGRILFRNAAGDTTRPADSVTVNLWSNPVEGGTYTNPVRTTVTSADGWYTFNNLPEYSEHAIEVPRVVVNGRAYQMEFEAIDTDLLTADSVVFNVDPTILVPTTGGSLSAITLSTRLVKGQPLVLEFSNPIDVALLASATIFTNASIQLRMNNGSTVSIASTLTWNTTFTSLSIMPYQSDWVDGAIYSVVLTDVPDVYGSALTTTFSNLSVPVTVVPLTAVTNLRLRATTRIRGTDFDTNIVDYVTTPYRLSWNKVNGAEGYSVYYRQSTDSAWQLRTTTNTAAATDTTVNLTPMTAVGKAWTRYLMVLPNSSTTLVPYSQGALLTVRDGVKPALATTNTITAPGGTSFAANVALRTIALTVPVTLANSQNDPIDTTKKPTVRMAQGPGSNAYVATASFVWTSLSAGRVDVVVAANQDARADSVVVDFTNVTDLAGNVFDNLGTAGSRILTYVTP